MPKAEPSSSSWRRFTKLKSNRALMRRRARKIESATLKHAHTFLIHRWDNVRDVRRHALGWVLLVAILIGLSGLQIYLSQRSVMKVAAIEGGTYAEGVVGELDTINPIFANTSAERSASRLVFASLLSYDATNQLRGELASNWTVDQEGKRYIVTIKPNLRWHDGAPLTADDVVFTVNTMKNPLVRSPLYSTWSGVTATKIDDTNVAFDIGAVYAPFPHALTFGILPKHILASTSPERLREADFNREPVGSGPFIFRNIQVIDPNTDRLVLHLVRNKYFSGGAPKLERFQLHTYTDHDELRRGFLTGEVTAAADLTTEDIQTITSQKNDVKVADAPLFDGMYALFRNDSDFLSDAAVRKALREGLNRKEIIESLGNYARPLDTPIIDSQANLTGIAHPAYDAKAAAADLEAAGWIRGNDGIRAKDGRKLSIAVVTPRTGDYPRVLEAVVRQWRSLGIDVKTQLVPPDSIQQNVLLPRAYDVLIYELAIGADPDVFAYWHSSQASPRGLNLANYRSGINDDALTSARSRLEPQLREAKYRSFTQQWLNDIPAVALYRPTLHYITNKAVISLDDDDPIVDPTDRYRNVQYWTVEEAVRYKTP